MNHCIADACNGWVIDDTGKIYKCWNDIGIPEKAIGNINLGDNYLQRTDLIEKYSSFEPTLYDECKECKLLPICIGGCPHSRMEGRRVVSSGNFICRSICRMYKSVVKTEARTTKQQVIIRGILY